MRPRHKAAENDAPGRVDGRGRGDASMRPRHKAAENLLDPVHPDDVGYGFNEAAA